MSAHGMWRLSGELDVTSVGDFVSAVRKTASALTQVPITPLNGLIQGSGAISVSTGLHAAAAQLREVFEQLQSAFDDLQVGIGLSFGIGLASAKKRALLDGLALGVFGGGDSGGQGLVVGGDISLDFGLCTDGIEDCPGFFPFNSSITVSIAGSASIEFSSKRKEGKFDELGGVLLYNAVLLPLRNFSN